MLPFIIIAERKKLMRAVFLGSVLVMAVTQATLALLHLHWYPLCGLMLFYFIAFNILEPPCLRYI